MKMSWVLSETLFQTWTWISVCENFLHTVNSVSRETGLIFSTQACASWTSVPSLEITRAGDISESHSQPWIIWSQMNSSGLKARTMEPWMTAPLAIFLLSLVICSSSSQISMKIKIIGNTNTTCCLNRIIKLKTHILSICGYECSSRYIINISLQSVVQINYSKWANIFSACHLKKYYVSIKCQSVQLLSRVQFFANPCTAARQASLSITNSRSLLKLMSIESMMPSNHLIICHPLLLSSSIFPSIRVFSKESVLHIRWPKYWSFSFSISPYNEYSGLLSFRMDWLDLPCSPRDS